MSRVFSGIQPSGDLHLGNYLGALRRFADEQHRAESLFCIVDLHAVTVPQDPASLRDRTIQMANLYLAGGLDPDVATLFVQSHVPAHTELAWLLECTASFGELSRMTQFKDKRDRQEFVSAALFTYPALMAADILLYETDRVPVGDDQRQHLELARDVAIRFNERYGPTFVVPEAAIGGAAARVMDLQQPTAKMSKSADSPRGTVSILDEPEVIRRKLSRAVTDSGSEVRYDPDGKPGVANLLSILASATDRRPEEVAGSYDSYGPLKKDAAEAVVDLLAPVQRRYAELARDPAATAAVLAEGARRARAMAEPVIVRARERMGLLADPGR